MKLNPLTTTIGGVLAATLALSACGPFGGTDDPEPSQVPGLPVDDGAAVGPAPTSAFDPTVPPRLDVEEQDVSEAAEAIRNDFAVALALSDDEAICLDETGLTEPDYIGLFEKGNEPTTAAAIAMDGCFGANSDRELAAWLVEHRFSLDAPSACFTQQLADYVTDPGWDVFVAEVDRDGYTAFQSFYLACGEQAPTSSEAAPTTGPVRDPAALGEVFASVLATTFALDDAATVCLSSALVSVIDVHGFETLSAAFAGDADDVDLTSPVAQDVYAAIGGCAPIPGVFVGDNAVVGIVRSMGQRVDIEGQACLASEFDRYAVEAGIGQLFVGFQDLVRETDTIGAIEVATMINGCVTAAEVESTEVDGSVAADVDDVTALAAELNFLDGSQRICIGFWMPGIVEQYGFERVTDSLLRAIDEIGYRDDVVDAVALAAVDCL